MRALSAAFLVLVSLGLAACGGGSASAPTGGQAEEAAKPVRVAQAGPAQAAAMIVAVGALAADKEYVLAFKTGGIVKSVAVEAGDRVIKGQRLAELDVRDTEAAFAQAQEAYEKAVRDLNRARELYRRGAGPLARVQDAETQVAVTRRAAEAARANRGYAAIIAPADGVVLVRHVEANGVVAAGMPVLTVSDSTSAVMLRVGLSDRDVVRVALEDSAEVRFDAFPGQVFKAAVSEIGADADPRLGVYAVKLRVETGDAMLKSGMIGRARIAAAAQSAAVAVPLAALLEADGDQAFVFVVQPDQTAKRTRVTIGAVSGEQVEVTEGLSAGDTVVVAGAGFLADGAKVTIATAEAR